MTKDIGRMSADTGPSPSVEPVPVSPVPASVPCAATGSKMPRPSRWDKEIARAAAEDIAKMICDEWDHDSSPEDWVDDLIKCKHSWDDGYRLARELERNCFVDGDREFVDVLDGASSIHDNIYEGMIRKWVQIVGFTPTFSVGDRVGTRYGDGTVWRIEIEKAQYIVATDDRQWGEGGGYVLNAEDVRSASAIEARQGEKPQALNAQHESAAPQEDAQ